LKHNREAQYPTDNFNNKVEGVFFQLMVFPNGRKRFLRLSRGAEDLLGYVEARFMEQSDLFYNSIYQEDKILYLEKEKEASDQLGILNCNFRYLLPDGKIMWLNVKSVPQKTDGGDYIWTGLFSDINDLKQQESNLVKINHELAVLNAINDVILSYFESGRLLSEVCNTLISKGGYKLAWMTNMSSINVQDSKIEPIVSAGEIDYIKEITIPINDSSQAKGPTISALLKQHKIVTNNIQGSDTFKPWRETALKYGIHSCITIPFMVVSEPYVLNVYASHVNAFNDHEKDILERVCNNLAQAITRINEEEQMKEYYSLLQERVKELSVLSEVSNVLGSEKSIESALSKIAFSIADGMFVLEDTSVVFNFNGCRSVATGTVSDSNVVVHLFLSIV
jgi:PAS domain S-box-containing protein